MAARIRVDSPRGVFYRSVRLYAPVGRLDSVFRARMSLMKTPPKPTEAELAILRVIWAQGPSTVRQIQETLERARPTGYTTVLKMLQIMWDKGLVAREESSRTHVYRARYSQERTQRQLVTDLLDRAFGGSSAQLVMQALATKRATPQEMDEIQKLLSQHRASDGDRR